MCRITLQIEHCRSRTLRRRIALALLRDLSPSLRDLSAIAIRHSDSMPYFRREAKRGVPLTNAPDLAKEKGRAGFEFRSRRLVLGLSLDDLSVMTGIHPTHLSRIESGRRVPRAATRERLEGALREFERTLAARRALPPWATDEVWER